jgi:hypothetical protein
MNRFTTARCAALVALALGAASAQAAITTLPQSVLSSSPGVYTASGYYTDVLGPNIVTTGGGNAANVGAVNGRNDDGFMALSLGFNVSFFGTVYNSLFINNNGNVSFGAGISAFVPTGPTGASAPVISPFFGDVDTRNGASGVVHYNLSADQLVVTWDSVGRFSARGAPFDSFQLVLRGQDYVVPTGEGSIGFFYGSMGWEVTDTSQVAAVGFGNGLGDAEVIAGSAQAGMAAVVNNHYVWFDPSLRVVPPTGGVPEPGSMALAGLALLAAGAATRRARQA